MELWIRSQDREKLMLANYFEIEQRNKNFLIMARNGDPYFDQCLGLYKTKERALEVLDEIQKKINLINLGHDFGSPMIDLENPTYIYEMSKE